VGLLGYYDAEIAPAVHGNLVLFGTREVPSAWHRDHVHAAAVEIALKMAFQWWAQRGESQRTGFICLQNGYHGDTLGCMDAVAPSPYTGARQTPWCGLTRTPLGGMRLIDLTRLLPGGRCVVEYDWQPLERRTDVRDRTAECARRRADGREARRRRVRARGDGLGGRRERVGDRIYLQKLARIAV